MKKILATLTAAMVLGLCAQGASASFTLFDLARESMFIARGEFTALERTTKGDRLTLRCDKILKGDMNVGTSIVLEAFELAPADEALGRDVIVGFNLIHGKHYFNLHPYAWRSFYFEDSDHAADGLNRNENALSRFIAINQPHRQLIENELRKRLEYESLAYVGEYPQALIDEWKAELLHQMAWAGTVAARDAAKCFVDHSLFRGTLSVEELQHVGGLLKDSQPGSIERAYMLEMIRNEFSAIPELPVLLAMLREETSQACVGKLSNLFNPHEDRAGVLEAIAGIAASGMEKEQSRVNALQTLAAMRDKQALPMVQQILSKEMEAGEEFNKNIVRGALKALRRLPDSSSEQLLLDYIASEPCQASWELTRRAWIAYATINSEATNKKMYDLLVAETNEARKKFFGHMNNAITRDLVNVFNED